MQLLGSIFDKISPFTFSKNHINSFWVWYNYTDQNSILVSRCYYATYHIVKRSILIAIEFSKSLARGLPSWHFHYSILELLLWKFLTCCQVGFCVCPLDIFIVAYLLSRYENFWLSVIYLEWFLCLVSLAHLQYNITPKNMYFFAWWG